MTIKIHNKLLIISSKLFWILVILISSGLLLFKFLPQTKTTNLTVKPSITPTPTFIAGGLQDYYNSYKNPYVIHLRKAIDGYLNGTNYGMQSPQLVIESSSSSGMLSGLSSFSKDYYKSKFVIFGISDSLAGGENISIIFQNKQDKLFEAWVYKLAGGTYDLRGFSQVLSITPEQMKAIQEQYKTLLEDKSHSL